MSEKKQEEVNGVPVTKLSESGKVLYNKIQALFGEANILENEIVKKRSELEELTKSAIAKRGAINELSSLIIEETNEIKNKLQQ